MHRNVNQKLLFGLHLVVESDTGPTSTVTVGDPLPLLD